MCDTDSPYQYLFVSNQCKEQLRDKTVLSNKEILGY